MNGKNDDEKKVIRLKHPQRDAVIQVAIRENTDLFLRLMAEQKGEKNNVIPLFPRDKDRPTQRD